MRDRQRFVRRRRAHHRVPPPCKRERQRLAKRSVVIHHQKPVYHRSCFHRVRDHHLPRPDRGVQRSNPVHPRRSRSCDKLSHPPYVTVLQAPVSHRRIRLSPARQAPCSPWMAPYDRTVASVTSRFLGRGAVLLGAVVVVALAVGCGGDSPMGALPTASEHGDFHVQLDVQGGAFQRGVNQFVVHATDPAGESVRVTGVSAIMPEHGHVAGAPTITPSADGYSISDLVLPMAGSWQITVDLATATLQDDVFVVTFVP